MNTILVTGAAGYIGSMLIRDQAKETRFQGSTVRILDNMILERYVALMDLPDGVDYEFLEGDIRKNEDLDQAFHNVDMVVDLAGITNAPLSFERKELTHDVNVLGGKKVADCAVKAGVKKYVYSSTASVYGPTNGVVTEETICHPISPYGESKLQAETYVASLAKAGRLNATVLRLGTVYGYSIGMRFDTVVDRFAYLASINMPLIVWESALQEKRPYLHVMDASAVLIYALRHNLDNGIYNVVNENASINRIVDAVKAHVPDAQVIISPTPNLNQVSYELDGSKVEKAGFRPRHGLDEGVGEIVQKFKQLVKARQRKGKISVPIASRARKP